MGTPEKQPIRIGNDEREEAVRALGDHFAHGRLEADEFEERVGIAYAARTAAELDDLFRDLPRPEAAPVPMPAAGPIFPAPPYPVQPYPMPPYPVQPWVATPAPYGWDPLSGRPYSDRSKVLAGVLQLFLPFGIGRFYTGHTGLAVAQLLTSFLGFGIFWCWLDGILLLAGRPTDPYGRPLRS